MNKVVLDYERAKNSLLQYFDCKEEYPIKVMSKNKWRITQSDDAAFLCYWADEKGRQDAVIARRDGRPIIVRKKEQSMVVAIDCIKMAFILDNKDEVPE